MTERRGHTVIFEGAGRIQTLVLQKQTPVIHIDILRYGVVGLKDRLALADTDLVRVLAKADQFAEPPDAGQIQPIVPAGPALGKIAQFSGNGNPVPIIADIQQFTAFRAFEHRLPTVVNLSTRRIYTFLISFIRHMLDSRISNIVVRFTP